MTVSEMRQQMGQQEFTQWAVYYGRKAQRIELESKKAGR